MGGSKQSLSASPQRAAFALLVFIATAGHSSGCRSDLEQGSASMAVHSSDAARGVNSAAHGMGSAQPKQQPSGAAKAHGHQKAAGRPRAAARGLAPDGSLQPSDNDRCPVCAMRITPEKKLASAIELADGTTYYFCGTGCLLKTWLEPQKHLRVPKSELKRAMTRDYFTGKPLNAEAATWIAGSDVVGPMGPAIIPHRGIEEASTFRKRHGGRHQFQLEDLTPEKWRQIRGKAKGH